MASCSDGTNPSRSLGVGMVREASIAPSLSTIPARIVVPPISIPNTTMRTLSVSSAGVHAAEFRDALRQHAAGGIWRREISHPDLGSGLAGKFPAGLRIARGDHHARAPVSRQPRGGGPNSGGPGNDENFAPQVRQLLI